MPTASPTNSRNDTALTVPLGRIVSVLAVRPILILAMGLLVLALGQSLVWTNALVIIVDIVSLIAVHLAMHAEDRRLSDLFRPARWSDIAWGLLCFVALLVALVVVTFLATYVVNLIVYHGPPPAKKAGAGLHIPLIVGILALIAPATVALAEEAVYRGYAQPRLARKVPAAASLFIVAAVFALQHWGFALNDPQTLIVKLVSTFAGGLVLGLLFLWLRRLVPLVLGHWLVDLLFLGLPTFFLALNV